MFLNELEHSFEHRAKKKAPQTRQQYIIYIASGSGGPFFWPDTRMNVLIRLKTNSSEFELVRNTVSGLPWPRVRHFALSSRRACRAELSFGRKLLAAASPRIHSRCTSGEEELLSGRGRAEKASRRRSASRFWSLVHSETFGRCQGLARARVRRVIYNRLMRMNM